MTSLAGGALRVRVFELLNNATLNGFDVRSWAPGFLTDDLMSCDADLEHCDRATVLAAVEEWLGRSEARHA